MKILMLLLLTSCFDAETISVYPHNQSWVCNSHGNTFHFTGQDAEKRAHERCDTFLMPYNKLKLNEGAKR
jgi:hypothetical protein